jgi:hypothetical protein
MMPVGAARAARVSGGDAIPDSGDLHAQYDATELSLNDGDSVTTWADETGNGYDLTAGTAPTYEASSINSNPAVSFDGADDFLDVDFSALTQPNTIFAVIRTDSVGENERIWDSSNGENDHSFYGSGSAIDYAINAGVNLRNGPVDTNNHIFSVLYNGPSSLLRIDGSDAVSGDAGTSSLEGYRLASTINGRYSAITVGEILVYPQDKSGIQSNVEQYLSSKWGVAV